MTSNSTKILADGGDSRAGLNGVVFTVDENAQQRRLVGKTHGGQATYHVGVDIDGAGQLLRTDEVGRGWDDNDVGGHQRHFLQLASTVLALGIDDDDVKVALHPGQHSFQGKGSGKLLAHPLIERLAVIIVGDQTDAGEKCAADGGSV